MTRTTLHVSLFLLCTIISFPSIARAAEEVVPEVPEEPVVVTTTGSISVCAIIIDVQGDMRTNSPLPVVTLTHEGRTEGALTLPTSTFTTPLIANVDAFPALSEYDASCVEYSGLTLGTYAYGELSYSNDADYNEPLYFDALPSTPAVVSNFHRFKEAGFESADGFVTLTEVDPNARIYSLSTYLACGPEVIPGECSEDTGSDEEEIVVVTEPEPEPTPAPAPSQGGGGIFYGSFMSVMQPTVEGPAAPASSTPVIVPEQSATSTGQVLGASCGMYLTKYMRRGHTNDESEVRKLQEFLNKYEGANIPVTGYFGELTENAVRKFQAKYANEVLVPWGIAEPTGIVYMTTVAYINKLECPSSVQEEKALTPWGE